MTLLPMALPGTPAASPGPTAPTVGAGAATAPGGASEGGEVTSVFSDLVAALTGQADEVESGPADGTIGGEADASAEDGSDTDAETAVEAASAAAVAALALLLANRPSAASASAPSPGHPTVVDPAGSATDQGGASPTVVPAAPELDGSVVGSTAATHDAELPAGEPLVLDGETADATVDVPQADPSPALDGTADGVDTPEAAEPTIAFPPEPEAESGPEPEARTAPVRPAVADGAVPLDGPDAVPVHASAPVTASASTAATTATTPAPRVPPPALPQQLVTVISPLREGPDGTHRVALQLRPDDLGEVHVDVRVKGNEISLNLRADLAGTTDLLRATLDELRSELESAGFRAGAFDVSDHAGDGPADARDPGLVAASTASTKPTTDEPDADRQATPSSAASGLDLRL